MSTTLVNKAKHLGVLKIPHTFSGGEELVFAFRPWPGEDHGIFGGVAAELFDFKGVTPLLDDSCLGESWRLIEGCRRIVLPPSTRRFGLEIRPSARVQNYTFQLVHIAGGAPMLAHAG